MQGWLDLKAAKRRLWKERGYVHYEHMDDEEITDSPHTVIFPNVTISFLPDNLIFFRSEPHPTDPEKCFFDLWCMAFPVEGQETCQSIMAGERPQREVEACEHRDFDRGRGIPELAGQIAASLDCTALAQFFWIGWEGAVLCAKLARSADPLQVIARGFFALLQSPP